jgi:hypothetical protein
LARDKILKRLLSGKRKTNILEFLLSHFTITKHLNLFL